MSTSRIVSPTLALSAVCALLAFAGCNRPAAHVPAADKGLPIERILKAGELRVGTSADSPPLTVHDRDGKLMGLEIDLVQALGDTMNVKVRFVEMPFAELIPALERGDIDLAVAGMTITPERNARVAFAGPYFVSGNTLLSHKRELAEAQDAAQLDDPKLSFAVLKGSTSEAFARAHLSKAKLVAVPDNDAGVKALLAGEVDGMISDLQVCTVARLRHPDAELHLRFAPLTTEPLGIAVAPDSMLFLNLVTNYLTTLEETGQLAQLKAKWLGGSEWLERLP
ncbi:MAG TPA: transporter substrate-binding domain-containing protein [Myxococcota bacterium]|nr:transporter substrate-binding domain-containing protein [Myxococcota bacterium]